MRLVSRRTLTLALLPMLAIAITAAFLYLTSRQSSSADLIELQGISEEHLAKNGITLFQPPTDFVSLITAQEAAQSGESSATGLKAKEAVLASVLNETLPDQRNQVLWVVSLDVTGLSIPLHGLPGSPPRTPYLYKIVFVDPLTGSSLYSTSLGAPIEPYDDPFLPD